MMRRIDEAIPAALLKADRIALIAHVNPDGDTIGSCLALQMGLMQLGKQADVYCQDKVPDTLMCLEGAELVRCKPLPDVTYDAAAAVDVSDARRAGSCISILQAAPVTMLVDHHGTNPRDWTQLSEVDGDAPACGLLIHALLEQLGVNITPEIAACLYAAISTDTGNFSYKGTSAECFLVVAGLMDTGFDMEALNRRLFRVKALPQSRLMCRALERLTLHADGRLAAIALTLQDFGDCAALPEHADTLVNLGLELQGVKMALLARETASGGVKFSLRAIPPYRVDEIAKRFGGGGHPLAAGCGFAEGRINVLIDSVITAMTTQL